jgi:hypothetical protein
MDGCMQTRKEFDHHYHSHHLHDIGVGGSRTKALFATNGDVTISMAACCQDRVRLLTLSNLGRWSGSNARVVL